MSWKPDQHNDAPADVMEHHNADEADCDELVVTTILEIGAGASRAADQARDRSVRGLKGLPEQARDRSPLRQPDGAGADDSDDGVGNRGAATQRVRRGGRLGASVRGSRGGRRGIRGVKGGARQRSLDARAAVLPSERILTIGEEIAEACVQDVVAPILEIGAGASRAPDQSRDRSVRGLKGLPEQARDRSPLRQPDGAGADDSDDGVGDRGAATQRVRRGGRLGASVRGSRGGRRGIRGVKGGASQRRDAVLPSERRLTIGEEIAEVCVQDEDVPLPLREVVSNLEQARSARVASRRHRAANVPVDDSVDEYMDAESFLPNELFEGDRGAMEFHWSPMDTFSGHAEEFLPEHPGPSEKFASAYDAFRKFWDDDILEHIVRETNRYAAKLKSSSARFAKEWYDTNVSEVLLLFAFWMMLGIIRMPSIKSCFTNDNLIRMSIFKKFLTEARYWHLNKALHFVDNSTRTEGSSKLFALGPVPDHLNAKFKEVYIPEQNISIDESLTLWKGNLSFRQYIKTKRARFGIKTFELCEAASGYMWSFIIYTGKDINASQSRMPKSTQVVVDLIRPLLNRGHKLFMDNWFNSPLLARFLKLNKTDCIGTLRINRENVPTIIQTANLPRGTCLARHSGDVVVLSYQDKKPVTMISTYHGTESTFFEARPRKPAHYKLAVIAEYNTSMGGVDKKDQMLEPYLIERKKNRKWYKKLFKRLLNVSINNSRILLMKSSSNATFTHQSFRLQLIESILDKHHPNRPAQSTIPKPEGTNHRIGLPAVRFSSGPNVLHWPKRNVPDGQPLTYGPSKTSVGRLCCMWCTVVNKKQARTVYSCKACEVPLCILCFEPFHTRLG